MTVPHQSHGRTASSRTARLPPHGPQLARITPGLEPSLIDNTQLTIESLDPDNPRRYRIAVAGPAALLVAKATKIEERHAELAAGKKDRVKTKDSVDCLRLLTAVETDQLVDGFERHRDGAQAEQVSRQALAYFTKQLERGEADDVRLGIIRELDDVVMASSYSALIEDLLESCRRNNLL